jgi:CheY-like chemotaxis protein
MRASPQALIVEKSESLRNLIAQRFSADGYGVATASSPEAALEVLRVSAPDVIVLDVLAADIRGFRAKLLEDPALVSSQLMVVEGDDFRERMAFWRM